MDTLWPTLVQFILRLAFGLTFAMAITPAKWVTSGFFRVHLWVVMGFATVASLAMYSNWPWYAKHIASSPAIPFALTISLAFVCYFGAVIWMYEQARLGKIAITLATLLSCSAGWLSMGTGHEPAPLWSLLLIAVDWLASGFTLGFFIASMFLGHWYLNWPGMKLEPRRARGARRPCHARVASRPSAGIRAAPGSPAPARLPAARRSPVPCSSPIRSCP